MDSCLDLGSCVLASAETGLSILVSNRVLLAHIGASDRTLLDRIPSNNIWVSRGATLCVVIDISWRSELDVGRMRHLIIHHLTTVLRTAPLWQQLHLEPSIVIETPRHTCTIGTIRISLQPRFHLNETGKKAPHRLGENVPPTDLKPPEGIPQADLEEVYLQFHLSREDPIGRGDGDLVSILQIIDAAFRLSITAQPRNIAAAVTILETTSFLRLDEICPAVWSPAHLMALASRAIFLPTISYALAHAAQTNSASYLLHAKSQEIQRQQGIFSGQSLDDCSAIQQALKIRLWRMMQHRLHSPAAAEGLHALFSADDLPDMHGASDSEHLDFGTTSVESCTVREPEFSSGDDTDFDDMFSSAWEPGTGQDANNLFS